MIARDDVIANLVEHWRSRNRTAEISASGSITPSGSLSTQVIRVPNIHSEVRIPSPQVSQDPPPKETSKPKEYPAVVVQAAVVKLGEATNEGQLVQGVSIAWFEIIKGLEREPNFLAQIGWRKLEELIAGAYEREGWPEVILTPRSNDRGRDVMATKPGYGSIRIFDQVKSYAPDHRVDANDVRALLGVLTAEPNVSKGIVTTSSDFAPGITKDAGLSALMPHRLELKNGRQLRDWLLTVSSSQDDVE